jgi:hypothetical protein
MAKVTFIAAPAFGWPGKTGSYWKSSYAPARAASEPELRA